MPLRKTYVDTATVVSDLQQLEPAIFNLNLQRRRAGVDGILDQLLECVDRSYDDLAGGDLVDHVLMQRADPAWRAAERVFGRALRTSWQITVFGHFLLCIQADFRSLSLSVT